MYAQLTKGYICQADLPNMRSAKFGVMVFKASMLDLGVDLPGRSAKYEICQADLTNMRSAKFGVTVFKASMLDWQGVDLPGRSGKYEISQ